MKGLITFLFLAASQFVYADPTQVPEKTAFPPINWVSHGSKDDVIIQNGSGTNIIVQITVFDNADSSAPGVDVRNCGTIKHIDAGSSAICSTHDANHPITFSSDSPDPAVGTYITKPA